MSEPCSSSGLKTADTAIVARAALLYSIVLVPAAAASSVVVYDNATAASGVELTKIAAVANGASVQHLFDPPLVCNNGIYCDVTGAAAGYCVSFATT